ncbi:MAG TPA: type II toxin-antitoxin system mRNA interferase toxin, RelE/StbE family [Patescibacteria group bacterium]|jgi:addiction module RelE/StbE family toxin|nr:type II toxin-antitoxin system mRNA interferase toxin, RelE/StbE family [Patescibacteria group bacterium]
MHIKLSPEVVKDLKKIKQKNIKLSERIQKQLYLFSTNPKHPSLRTHKLNANMSNLWSISITMSVRMVYKLLSEDNAYFVKIGTHKEVYN